MKTITIIGCDIGDEIFTSDLEIFGEEVVWNKTRIMHDAEAGKFGAPDNSPLEALGPMTAAHAQNGDWPKVEAMIAAHKAGDPVLSKPVIVVATMVGPVHNRIIIDGNHRITARQKLGMRSFLRYIVPPEFEKGYRVRIIESEV